MLESDSYVMPEELRRPVPRRVQRRPGTMRVSTIVNRILLLPAVVAGICLLGRVPLNSAIALTFGNDVDGQVERIGESAGSEQRYDLDFSYTAGGTRHFGARPITHHQYQKLGVGQRIPVRVVNAMGKRLEEVLLPDEVKWQPIIQAVAVAVVFNVVAVGVFLWRIFAPLAGEASVPLGDASDGTHYRQGGPAQ